MPSLDYSNTSGDNQDDRLLANSVINSLDARIAVLNEQGVIMAVNEAWKNSATENNNSNPTDYVGSNYLAVCDTAIRQGDLIAQQVEQGILAVINGAQSQFSTEYPCHTPTKKLWFTITVLPLRTSHKGVVVIHNDITNQKQIEESIRVSHEQLTILTSTVPGVVYQFVVTADGEWKFIYLSKGIEDLYEVTPANALLDHNVLTGCIFPEDRISHRDSVEIAVRNLSVWVHEHRILTPRGNIKWVRGQASPQPQEDGSVLWNGILVDITKRKQIEEALSASEAQYKRIVETAEEGIWTVNLAGTTDFINARGAAILGYQVDEIMGKPVSEFVFSEETISSQEELGKNLLGTRVSQVYRMQHKSGHEVWVQANTTPVYDQEGLLITGALSMFTDITAQKRLQDRLQKLAITDDLTGVYNRRHFIELAHFELERAVRFKHPLALALLDIDYFKFINDTYGHATGDQVLVAFAKTCQTHIRAIDVFARFGGDEFILLLPETDQEQARDAIERLRLALSTELPDLSDNLVAITITITSGISILASSEETFETILSRADHALYHAKKAGRNRTVVYSMELPKSGN